MKYTIKSVVYFCLVLLCSCSASGETVLKWEYDGTVKHGARQIKTKLQNTYYAFNSEDGIYLAGFVIDKMGVNHPYLVFVKNDLTEQYDWAQEATVEQVFTFNEQLYLLDEDGNTKRKSKEGWSEGGISFLPKSKVVYSNSDIIACVPSPLAKNSLENGNCYSLKKGWRVNLAWRSIQPAVCGDYLTTIEDNAEEIKGHEIDLDTGKIVKTISLKVSPSQENLCKTFVSN